MPRSNRTRPYLLLWLTLLIGWAAPGGCQDAPQNTIPQPELVSQTGHTQDVSCTCFSPDGRTLASGSEDHTIKLWDTATGQLLHTLAGHTGAVNDVCFSPDGMMLASGALDGTVKLWDPASGQMLHTLTAHASGGCWLCFSSYGKILDSEAYHSSIAQWDTATGQLLRTNTEHTDADSGCFSPDGKMLASDEGGFLKVLDVSTGQVLYTLDLADGECFSTDDKMLAVADQYGIDLYDASSGHELHTISGRGNAVTSVCFSSDGKAIASGLAAFSNTPINLWDISAGRVLNSPSDYPDTSKSIYSVGTSSVAFSPDGKRVARGSFDGAVSLWDARNGRLLQTFTQSGSDYVNVSVCYSPDGKMLAVGSTGSTTVKLLDSFTGRLLRAFQGHNYSSAVCISPDGTLLASGGGSMVGGIVTVWETRTGRLLRTLSQDASLAGAIGSTSLSFSQDGKTLARGFDTFLNLWSVATGQSLDTPTQEISEQLLFHRDNQGNNDALTVNSICFSPDGKTLAGGLSDGTVHFWDAATGQLQNTLSGHAAGVTSVCFSPDGRNLASGSDDSTINLWDAADGHKICTLSDFGDGHWAVVAPDGRFDTDDLDDQPDLHWVLPDAPFTPLPLELFMRQYYEPRLLPRLLAHDPTLDRPVPSIADLNRVQPPVKITGVILHPGDDSTLVDVTITASRASGTFQRDGRDVVDSTGVYDLSLFRDGQLVGRLPEGDEGTTPTDLTAGTPDGTVTHTFTVRLPRNGEKAVTFSAYAFNVSQVKSETDRFTYTLPRPLPVVPGNAYVISLGVNSYEDPGWDLRFAANDADRTVRRLTQALTASGRFAHVYAVPLVSDDATRAQCATRAALRAVLDRLAGADTAQDDAQLVTIPGTPFLVPARPEDLVVLTFSCHGDNDPQSGAFYLFPADIGPDQEQGLTDDLKAHAISSDDLSRWLRGVDAGQIALVVDACHSAASVDAAGFKPGPMGSRGLGQLAYDKGMRVLAASQADDVALESDQVGDGLLTYALIHDGLEAGQADADPRDGTVTLAKWLRYGVNRVPSLYAQVLAGHVDAFGLPAPRSIPLGTKGIALINAPAGAAPVLQQPALFDFNKQATDPVLEVLPHGAATK